MATNYFTFGCGQTFKDHYVIIEAADAKRCRELMMEAFGEKWSMQYDETQQPGKYGEQPLVYICEPELGGSKTVSVFPAEIHHR